MRLSILGRFLVTCAMICLAWRSGDAADWSRFRGPNGLGVPTDGQAPPIEWSDSKNLKWKAALPGPGISSPIVVGNRVFITCWSGYGVDPRNPGEQRNLRRHLVCVDRSSGKILWSSSVEAALPEDPYRGQFVECGYAAHTPVSDGERVYAFFGKTGILAYDLEGNKLWQKSVGTESDRRGWGTASSPILYKDLVIVPATTESKSLVAFHKLTGEQVWKAEADGFAATWGTPILVELPEGRTDLVISVPFELWAFNPDTGKLRWYCDSINSDSACSSVIAQDGIVYVVDGMSGSSIAVRAGGKDDVTKTHVVWSGRERGRITTPVYHNGRLYWISGGVARCIDAASGKSIYQARVERSSGQRDGERPNVAGGRPGPGGPREGGRPGGFGGGRPGFGGGGFGGGMGGQDYSSPVVAGGRLYYAFRSGETVVVKLGDQFEQLGTNRFQSDTGDFSATPAISDGELFVRSSTHLYCVGEAR